MSNDGVNAGRHRLLVAATSVVGAARAVDAAAPLVGSQFPSVRVRATGAPVQVNVGKIDPSRQIIAEWHGKPVFIVHRTKEMLDALPSLERQLADPDSKASEQSEYVDSRLRSTKSGPAVIVGIYTHLGCSPTFRSEVAPASFSPDWKGGYFCPCHGSHYDPAGHVYKGQPAPLNLLTPPYTFGADDVITIGVDQKKV